ncbi:hypothetical protein FPQ18DRAFT_384510 [Pyronema domesticum]|uniref:F-box domain-containing protein n=1 Tax=Pyronema omphalodes (strain CBS 100304) TaxID=1076935 RepID=U4LM35_PYROM|nr:hypothetical protein FPQ18DRAFT_384510 [Pyronema domesticum]CCX14889.1 Protein of unknown function [Pyronema omphalodes CBS 100304]
MSHIPNEIVYMIFQEVTTTHGLATLCRLNKFYNSIFTPVLYKRGVTLSTTIPFYSDDFPESKKIPGEPAWTKTNPAHWAIRRNQVSTFEKLLCHGLPPNIPQIHDNLFRSRMHPDWRIEDREALVLIALHNESVDIVRILMGRSMAHGMRRMITFVSSKASSPGMREMLRECYSEFIRRSPRKVRESFLFSRHYGFFGTENEF